MSAQQTTINPKILRWARERAGYSIEDVARALKKKVEAVSNWEEGVSGPTYAQLERLAYELYKRPLALFYFPEPPSEPTARESFRTLPDSEIEGLLPDTRHALREARARKLSLIELTGGTNPSKSIITKDLKLGQRETAKRLAERVRDYLGIAVSEQIRWRTARRAFEVWRDVIQERGVFVFKRPFKQTSVSGFCLFDESFPLIYVNNSNSFTRQSFTLFHELCHLIAEVHGITMVSDAYISLLRGRLKRIEVLCNSFAAELLMPSADFDTFTKDIEFSDEAIARVSDRYKVSREVVLRRLLDKNIVNQAEYEFRAEQWRADFFRRRGEQEGGNYYYNQVAYLGLKYLRLAYQRFYEGRFSAEQLAEHLNIKASSISGLEAEVLRRAAN